MSCFHVRSHGGFQDCASVAVDYANFVGEDFECDWYFKPYAIHSSEELVVNFCPGDIIATPTTDAAETLFWNPDIGKTKLPPIADNPSESDTDSSYNAPSGDSDDESGPGSSEDSSVNPLPLVVDVV